MNMLYFYYGPMGSAKTATALMKCFNFFERAMKALLLKPSTDTRDGVTKIRSRIGLEADAIVVHPDDNIISLIIEHYVDAIIIDEAQFLTRDQIIQLRDIVSCYNIPVWCYGLRTDFRGELFEGSKALFELADEIHDIESVCDCGTKALIIARFDKDGNVIVDGDVVDLGGNEKYKAVCWKCYQKLLRKSGERR